MTKSPSFTKLESDFSRKLNKLAHGKTYGQAFGDWLEIAAIVTHQQPYHAGLLARESTFDTLEQKYLEIISAYQQEELTHFAEMYGIAQCALSVYQTDFLGPVYQELEMGNKKQNSEFFTPPALAQTIARFTLADAGQKIEENGYFTLEEPASGAGGLIIAAANYLHDQDYDPRKVMLFQATDINRHCFNMTYIQTSLMALVGTVRHGDTLARDIWETRPTPQLCVNQVLHQLDPWLKAVLLVDKVMAAELATTEQEPSALDAPREAPPAENTPKPAKQQPSPEESPQKSQAHYEQLNLFDLMDGNDSR